MNWRTEPHRGKAMKLERLEHRIKKKYLNYKKSSNSFKLNNSI